MFKRSLNQTKMNNKNRCKTGICKTKIVFVFIIINFNNLLEIIAQDGSSELPLDKNVPTATNNRLRVRCTDDNLRLYLNATACADEREPESCRMVFSTPASNNPAGRDPKCDNPLLSDIAAQCRRTCAICCEDPSYACQNDESGIVNCSQNMEKCGLAEFSAMMVKFCPATCGLCITRKCRDQIEECDAMKSLCTNEIYATFMEHQCAKTCGKCHVEGEDVEDYENEYDGQKNNRRKLSENNINKEDSKINKEESDEEDEKKKVKEKAKAKEKTIKRNRPKSANNEKCVDIWKNCKKNKKFCRHKSYIAMMKQNCAKTCGFCKPSKEDREYQTAALKVINLDCIDNHPFCKGWAANGYCESEEYTDQEKEEKCAKTCGYC